MVDVCLEVITRSTHYSVRQYDATTDKSKHVVLAVWGERLHGTVWQPFACYLKLPKSAAIRDPQHPQSRGWGWPQSLKRATNEWGKFRNIFFKIFRHHYNSASPFRDFPFSALTLLVGRHPACKKLGVGLLMVTFWLELCTSYNSSCYHHLHHPQFQ